MTGGLKFRSPGSLIYVPDPTEPGLSLSRTTHLGIVAHPDDLEIAAFHGIIAGISQEQSWFSGATLTGGLGGPRAPHLVDATDAVLCSVRREEQMAAAELGQSSAHVFLDYRSEAVRDLRNLDPTDDLRDLLKLATPEVVYTHALSDRHETHVATALRVIDAARTLPPEQRPQKLLGCEVWGDLDWLPPPYRVELDVSGMDELARNLILVFQSQIGAGKSYDQGTLGRRAANATFAESHAPDGPAAVTLAMDLTPLVVDSTIDPLEFLGDMVEMFRRVTLRRLQGLVRR